jgi:hypothetical protein
MVFCGIFCSIVQIDVLSIDQIFFSDCGMCIVRPSVQNGTSNFTMIYARNHMAATLLCQARIIRPALERSSSHRKFLLV